jgi:hypothetical protein
MQMQQEERIFFFEKKKQKTFVFRSFPLRGPGPHLSASAGIKVFCFFFSKKKILAHSSHP